MTAIDITQFTKQSLLDDRARLVKAAQSLINNLPDCTIDWARDGIGHTNAAAIIASRDQLRSALELAG